MFNKHSVFAAFLIAMILSALFLSCKKAENTSVTPYGKVVVTFANEVDGQPLKRATDTYTNAAGNQYTVNTLKYYVSNFTLVRDDGSERNFKNYKLVDASKAGSESFTLDSVANGSYSAVKFYLGVDPSHNSTGLQEGDLDPVHGMIWTWKTGYIFFKHLGQFRDSTGQMSNIRLDYGTDAALVSITLPISKFEVKGDTRNLSFKFDLNKAYSTTHVMDFNLDGSHMSTDPNDIFWIVAMKANFSNAFSFDKVQ